MVIAVLRLKKQAILATVKVFQITVKIKILSTRTSHQPDPSGKSRLHVPVSCEPHLTVASSLPHA
jgi:hypothetical protein